MKVIVAGSREVPKNKIREIVDFIIENLPEETTHIICGEARGIDSIGKKIANTVGLDTISMPADWEKFGQSAGHIRNGEMAKIADMLILVWDGSSKGSSNMKKQATKRNLVIREMVFLYDEDVQTK